jgi:uncharacterized protein (TIGR03382 family)
MRHTFCKKLFSTALLAATLCALPALAALDSYGVGTGEKDGKDLNVSYGETRADINAYTQVKQPLSEGDKVVWVDSTTNFKPGSLVMVYQATGLVTPDNQNPSALNLTGSASVGRWELARLTKDVNSNHLNLDAPLIFSYAANATQVISVPEYRDVTVQEGGVLTAKEWEEATGTGGVLAFLASGKVLINGTVDMKGKGFLGGQHVTCPGSRQPGKGIASRAAAKSSDMGRMRWANGGGGGGCDRAGGGGGGSAGVGGQGGYSFEGKDQGGEGGLELDLGMVAGNEVKMGYDSLTRLILGGGGGAGSGSSASATDFKGGAGGGIIFIRGKTLEIAGSGSIIADGKDGVGSSNLDAGGNGGGAGGSILLRFAEAAVCKDSAIVQANGGMGTVTRVDENKGKMTFRGPGGGGGGGFVQLQYAEKGSSACVLSVLHGNAGQPSSTPIMGGANYGAAAGKNGKKAERKTGLPSVLAPVVTQPAAASRVGDSKPTYRGTISDSLVGKNALVHVYVDGKLEGTVSIGKAREWELKAKTPLKPGPHTVNAVAVDREEALASGVSNTNDFIHDIKPPTVSVARPADGLRTRETKPVYEGSVWDDGPVTVKVRVGDGPWETATVKGNTWSYTPTVPLAPGAHTVTAEAEDAAALTATASRKFAVDTTTYVKVTAPGKDSKTQELQPECIGTVADDGPGPLTVMVSVDDGPPEPAKVTGNTWSYTPKEPLVPGVHKVTATVRDDVGNEATDLNDFTVIDRDFAGRGMSCAASGGTPSALAMVGLAVLSALLVRRRKR